MKKIFATIATSALLLPLLALGHGDAAAEAAGGEEIVNKLNAKTVTCATLKDDDFEKVGEFYMHRMMGEAHGSMNKMMEQMMGQEGEEQMHVTMGKRMSGCDTSAKVGMMQGGNMMSGIMGGMLAQHQSATLGAGISGMGGGMMNRGFSGTRGSFGWMGPWFSSWSWLGWLAMAASALFWILVIVLLIGLIRWVWKKGSNS